MATKKRIHVSLSNRDVQLIQELEVELDESKTAVLRRSVENFHAKIFNTVTEEPK